MLEAVVLLSFILALAVCLFTGASILYALAVGYLLFFLYGLRKGHSAGAVFSMSLAGIKTVKNVLMIFGLIGLITALWRASGTIPVIVCYASRLIVPSAFLVITFLLNSLLSVLTGTSFGTAATMGVICMSMGNAMRMNPMLVGGAILSGAFWGDRCSPVSSSANLVCDLTGTDIFENIHGMLRTSWVPTVLSCLLYYVLGCSAGQEVQLLDVEGLFAESFRLHWIAVLPAAVILVLSAMRVPVKRTLLASILLALIFSITLQGMEVSRLLSVMVFGYKTSNGKLSAMVNGGGLISMVRPAAIVMLSSSYAGIFEETGLLNPIRQRIETLSLRLTSFGSTLLVSMLTSMVACNQTLSVMLTSQLCRGTQPDAKRFAIDLENTAIVVAPLVPWSIAGAVPLAAVGAPSAGILAACYLYLVPLWNLCLAVAESARKKE
ncbi:MAG: Na+/H+ antiporter NhaC family protein [Clostridium sp.]|nr:sodium:proton antiporter [Clostridiaceae bacterium]MDD6074898.1 Na+/H+ antiporter NhaC family protein [Clostridium sp.]MDY5482958.1 Na+/H+ antiporter NhaC family protein [Clostridium sp.]